MSASEPLILVHGGAGDIPESRVQAKLQGVCRAVREAYKKYDETKNILDATQAAVESMEIDKCFNADLALREEDYDVLFTVLSSVLSRPSRSTVNEDSDRMDIDEDVPPGGDDDKSIEVEEDVSNNDEENANNNEDEENENDRNAEVEDDVSNHDEDEGNESEEIVYDEDEDEDDRRRKTPKSRRS